MFIFVSFFSYSYICLQITFVSSLTQHGGSTNAFTSSENTNYFFDVNTDGFEEALDR